MYACMVAAVNKGQHIPEGCKFKCVGQISGVCKIKTFWGHAVAQNPVSLTMGLLKNSQQIFNILFMNLEIFLEKSCGSIRVLLNRSFEVNSCVELHNQNTGLY
jgi:hypothetical protein